MLRRVLLYALAGALIGAGVAPSVGGACRGDANGDRRVDVLDLQAVIAQVLESGEDCAQADVNSDGAVDIRDYQCILAHARKIDADSEVPADENGDEAVALNNGQRQIPLTGFRRVASVHVEADQGAAASRAREERSTTASPKTERYVSRLSPRAPPVIV